MNETTTWLLDRIPADRDLTRPELTQLATDLGREPRLWQHLVRHDPEERYFTQLHRDVHLDVWLICWLNAQDTGFHDHDLSSGAVYIADGALAEDRFHFEGDDIRLTERLRGAGDVFDFDAAYIHRMRHVGDDLPVTSVHCYSPALWRMGYYEPDAAGDLCRTSITYMDEVAESHSH
ncbi:MAG: cysteine dioxygenase family protein [Actinomycetota bacterium]|nr:cysteine dioxygenase family protein [Actinomycetota bacterium]